MSECNYTTTTNDPVSLLIEYSYTIFDSGSVLVLKYFRHDPISLGN